MAKLHILRILPTCGTQTITLCQEDAEQGSLNIEESSPTGPCSPPPIHDVAARLARMLARARANASSRNGISMPATDIAAHYLPIALSLSLSLSPFYISLAASSPLPSSACPCCLLLELQALAAQPKGIISAQHHAPRLHALGVWTAPLAT